MSFGELLGAGAWRTWLTDAGLRANLLLPEACAEHVKRVARSLGQAPRDPSGLALLSTLGDADAREELASQLGDPKHTEPARRILKACASKRLPSPVPAVRIARAVAQLDPASIDTWLLAT